MSVCIAYYYSVDRAGRPVSVQENASRRSRKVAQRSHARRYEQVYTGCLIINDKNKSVAGHFTCMANFLSKLFLNY